MVFREYRPADVQAMAKLFYETVHTVNAKDYTEAQLEAWADGNVDLAAWDRSFQEHYSLVAEEDGEIVGFGDIDSAGYLDRLYVHKDFQGRGIASALCDRLEAAVCGRLEALGGALVTHASITARPFFECRGYVVVKEQQVIRHGVALTNFVMEKVVPK